MFKINRAILQVSVAFYAKAFITTLCWVASFCKNKKIKFARKEKWKKNG